MKLSRTGRRGLVVLATVPVVAASLFAPVAASAAQVDDASGRLQTEYSAKPLPTVQVNGVVWDQVVVGDVVYVTGQFTSARPAGAKAGVDETARSNILAYDLNTGELIEDFAPVLNNTGRSLAVSDDGKTLYVGGSFDKVDGTWHGRLAAFDLTKGHGQLISSFKPMFSTTVNAIDVHGSTVYAGGAFKTVNGVARTELAAVSADKGTLLDWKASATGTNSQVYALKVSPDGSKVVVGGSFQTLNGSSNPGYGLAMLDASTGAMLSTPVNSTIRVAGNYGAILDLEVDDSGFYGAAYSQSVSRANLEGTFKSDWNGNLTWVEPCHGDSYGIYPDGDQVYVANHAHSCQTIGGFPDYTWKTDSGTTLTKYYRGLAFTNSPDVTISSTGTNGYKDWSGYKSPELLDWYPDLTAGTFTGMNQAAYNVTGTDDYLLMAGEFTAADGTTQQGLVRYAKRTATTSEAPEGTGDDLKLTASSYVNGLVSISYQPTWDRDDTSLTYKLYRDDQTAPVDERTISSRHWDLQAQSLTDKGVSEGTHTYHLVVTDAEGNSVDATTTVEVGAGSTLSPYDTRSVELGATHLWTFDETSGSTLKDLIGGDDMTTASGVALGQSGVRSGSSAVGLNGLSSGTATAAASDGDIQTFTVETWIKTDSSWGGPIVGYKNGTSLDRLLYMDSAGRVRFGVYPGSVKALQSGTGYNDGQWHLVTATLGKAGTALYVDGKKVASDSRVTSAQSFNGYWTLGVGTTSGWPGSVYDRSLEGSVDGVTVYPTQLTDQQVSDHYGLSTNQAPTASFSASTADLTADVDAFESADADGSIASYAWDFGDGSTGEGKAASHTYAEAGTYTVALTVTDDKGTTTRTTSQVTVTAPVAANVAPEAAFTATVSSLTADVDASDSVDPDGSIASYAWDFGDGSTGEGKTASHTYAEAGTHTVTLTVTDDKGLSSQSTQEVTTSEPVAENQAPTAAFSVQASDLDVALDANESSDPDGSIASYAWDFGDGTTGEGTSLTHTFKEAGTYTVTLTVTDDKGATAQTTQSVVVAAPAVADGVLVKDSFARDVPAGWGDADRGGSWTVTPQSRFSVANGEAVIALNKAGSTSTAALKSVSSDATETLASYTLTEAPTGGGVYTSVVGRQTASGSYNVRVRITSDGALVASLTVISGGKETSLAATRLSGTRTPGTPINVRFQTVGTSPTTLQAKVWTGDTEPDAWTLTATDSTDGLQTAGWIGLTAYTSGSSTSTTGSLELLSLSAASVTE
ncbi:PKD domain-containing protein [Actinomyces radicidentis]|uniref:PKD domain-containing protein n=1 Tax=Actinomyces radicidentis TaxID=111015 RepID=UPI0028E641A2|nr:PKD domain-containing protein [Actinomyces radicidentis]